MTWAGTMQAIEALVRRGWRYPALSCWLLVLAAVVLIVVVGPMFLQPPDVQHLGSILQHPSGKHWLGTDEFGRDVLSRVVSAGRVSLGIGAAVTVVAVALGGSTGMVAAFYPRRAGFIMRFADAFQAFPVIVLAIALAVALSTKVPGAVGEVIALAAVYTPLVARVVRSRALVLANTDFVAAARVSGVRRRKILLIHVVPNCVPVLVVQATFVYATSLLSDAALSFLGLGVAPPTPTWGNMIADAKTSFATAPWFMIAPGLAIVISVGALTMIGDRLRVLVDPRAKALHDMERMKRRRRRNAVIEESDAGPSRLDLADVPFVDGV